ncbi:MAG: tetratricopeptide repeat protein [Deltaproteobacteria bacterium]|nr:tetratricopeptide repeat protein [Deltaproteobacteria bacterium]
MKRAGIELYTRQPADLPTLRALRRALEQAGECVSFTVASDGSERGSSEPPPCKVRVVVDCDDLAPVTRPERLVVIEDTLLPPTLFSHSERLSDPLATADLVLVPGPARAQHLRGRVAGEVAVCGLARLDELWRESGEMRVRARRKLGIPENGHVVLYAPTADPIHSATKVLGDEIASVTASGWMVLILPQAWPQAWLETQRALVASSPGLALLDAADQSTAMAAADVVVADGGSLLYEAIALGKGAIWVELTGAPSSARHEHRYADLGQRVHNVEELERALRSELSASPGAARFAAARSMLKNEILSCEGAAASQMAEEIRARFCPRPAAPEPVQASSDDQVLENIEAQVAFGDIPGARQALAAHLAAHPSPRAYRLLATICRREGELEEARLALERAEPLLREELARVLCERANLQLESDAHEAARATFEEAQRLAPELEDPWVGLGSLALHAGDAAGGERAFREALVRGKSGRTWCGLGLALVAQNRGREAVSSFEASLELEADRLAAVYGLVQAAFQCGELEAAERRVAAFVELHSGNLDMLFTLAGLRYQLGNRSGACEMLERIEVFKPDYPGLAELMEKLQA